MLLVYLTLSPEPSLLSRIPFGQVPFLQALRQPWLPMTFVRALLRYYELVRLPAVVHRGRTPIGFAARTLPTGQGQRQDLPGSVQRASVRAWGLRPRGVRAHLAMAMRAMLLSELGNVVSTPDCKLSRLDGQPAHSPVNACRKTLGPDRHDSGSVWFAIPSLYETFIRCSLPIYPGASPGFAEVSCLLI